MFTSRNFFLGFNLASLLFYSSFSYSATTESLVKSNRSYDTSPPTVFVPMSNNRSYFYIGFLYLQPSSDNLKYATFVSGLQPYYQSWHYQEVRPEFHPAFELGFNYAIPNTSYSASVNWIHLNSNDSDFKQAARNTDLSTVEFVAPPFEMSPPVFGIKRGDSKVNFDFDNVLFNVSKLVDFSCNVQARFFGGISVLSMNQTIDTTFSDYAGSPPTPYSYPLPPDPTFSFNLQNTSRYIGAGPDVGLSVHYRTPSGFGLLGEFLGMLTVGTIKSQDNFTATSARLTQVGVGTSHQQITSPNDTQVVFGADSKLGVFYNYQGISFPDITIEAGWRMATYLNAIQSVNPSTLVQPGTVIITPEFSTGTMAIVSTDSRSRPFSFNGPFIDLKIAIA